MNQYMVWNTVNKIKYIYKEKPSTSNFCIESQNDEDNEILNQNV